MIPRRSISCALLLLSISAHAAPESFVSEARALFNAGKYIEGRKTLLETANNPDSASVDRAHALFELGNLYAERIGDYDMALSFYKRAAGQSVPDGHPVMLDARRKISLINGWNKEHKALNALFREMMISAGTTEKAETTDAHIGQLMDVVASSPNVYKIADVYYFLGSAYHKRNRFSRAERALKTALELRPGIDFHLPVSNLLRENHTQLVRYRFNRISRFVLGLLLSLSFVFFYASRPWQWVKWRHLAILVFAAFGWIVAFLLSLYVLGGRPAISTDTALEIGLTPPVFVNTLPGSPGWTTVLPFLWYGLFGILGTAVICIGTTVISRGWLRVVLNASAGFLLCASLMTIAYLRHCDQCGTFYSETHGVLRYPSGNVLYQLSEPERFILTNPKAYSGLDLGNADSELLKRWIVEHCETDEQN